MPFEHMLYFHTREQAEEASQLSISCTNMVVTTSSEMIAPLARRGFCGLPSVLMEKRATDEKPVLSFQTDYPLGPITQIALAHETHAIQVVANSPIDRTKYTVSPGQILLTGAFALFFIGLERVLGAGIAQTMSAIVATGWIAICSNDLLPILRSLARTRKPVAVQDEEEPTHV